MGSLQKNAGSLFFQMYITREIFVTILEKITILNISR